MLQRPTSDGLDVMKQIVMSKNVPKSAQKPFDPTIEFYKNANKRESNSPRQDIWKIWEMSRYIPKQLEEVFEQSLTSDEEHLAGKYVGKKFTCDVLPGLPLSKLRHFKQLNDYVENLNLTDERVPPIFKRTKWFVLPWFGCRMRACHFYTLDIPIGLSPLEQILTTLLLHGYCFDVTFFNKTSRKALKPLNLSSDFPLELLIHYATCLESVCDVGPALNKNEDFMNKLKKNHFFCSELNDLSNMCNLHNTNKAILTAIIKENESCRDHQEANNLCKNVETCMQFICDLIKEKTGLTNISIKLVGSSSEKTSSYFPDEFDYLLILQRNILTNIHAQIKEVLQTIDMFNFNIEGKLFMRPKDVIKRAPYFELFMTWQGTFYKNLNIKVDFVPVINTDTADNYLLPDHCCKPTEPTVRMSLPFDRHPKLDFSVVENEVIKALPANARNGYTLAKAIRVSGIFVALEKSVHTILADKNYDEKNDLCKIFYSYMLKTCLFYVTKDKNKHSEKRSIIYWASQIYAQLLNFIIVGGFSCFFNSSEKILKSRFSDICSSKCFRKTSDATQKAGQLAEKSATDQKAVESGKIPPQNTCSMDTKDSSHESDQTRLYINETFVKNAAEVTATRILPNDEPPLCKSHPNYQTVRIALNLSEGGADGFTEKSRSTPHSHSGEVSRSTISATSEDSQSTLRVVSVGQKCQTPETIKITKVNNKLGKGNTLCESISTLDNSVTGDDRKLSERAEQFASPDFGVTVTQGKSVAHKRDLTQNQPTMHELDQVVEKTSTHMSEVTCDSFQQALGTELCETSVKYVTGKGIDTIENLMTSDIVNLRAQSSVTTGATIIFGIEGASGSRDTVVTDDNKAFKKWELQTRRCFRKLIVIGRVLQVLAAGEPDLKIVREDFLDRLINVACRRHVKDIQYPGKYINYKFGYEWDPNKKGMQYPGDYILDAVYNEWTAIRF